MRADRLLSILLLLQVNQRVTARELAQRLEVSERTILRDMDALCMAGVPITAERGTGGGWRLLQDYHTDLTGLNTAEVQTLFFARSSGLIHDLGLGKAADAALIKLLASLSSVSRRDVEFTRARLHVDGAGWYKSDEAFPWLPVLQEAVWQERRVQFAYQRADGTAVERFVDPLGLVAKGSTWYLVAAVGGEMRSYRVSRVQQARVVEESCVRPDGFDLAAFWEQSVAEFQANVPRYPATRYAAPEWIGRLRCAKRPIVVGEQSPDADGWASVSVMFGDVEEACDYILRAGLHVVAVEPPELRERVRALAASILALYVAEEMRAEQNPRR